MDPLDEQLSEVIEWLEREPLADFETLCKKSAGDTQQLLQRLHSLRDAGLLIGSMKLSELHQNYLLETPKSATEPTLGLPTRYSVCELIAKGGMGEVWRATDHKLRRNVAIKLLRTDSSEHADYRANISRVARFLNEAETVARLQHPSIVPIYEIGLTAQGTPYISMMEVQGETLAELFKPNSPNRRVDSRQLANWIHQVCLTVSFAHRHGVIHRDLTPANIMVSHDQSVWVMDWGLATSDTDHISQEHRLEGARLPTTNATLTQTGDLFGTPHFVAPEQSRGEATTPQSDVYSVGAALYFILTGHHPDHSGDWEKPSRSTPRELIAIARRALSLQPSDRYESMDEFADDLSAYLSGRPGTAWRDTWATSLARQVRRHPRLSSTAATLLIGIPLLLTFLLPTLAVAQSSRTIATDYKMNERIVDSVFRHNYIPDITATSSFLLACKEIAGAFSDAEIDLHETSMEVFLEDMLRLRERNPALYAVAIDAFYWLSYYLERSGISEAARSLANEPAGRTRFADKVNLRAYEAEEQELIALYHSLPGLIRSIDSESARYEVWLDWSKWWRNESDELTLYPRTSIYDIDFSTFSAAEELVWLGTALEIVYTDADPMRRAMEQALVHRAISPATHYVAHYELSRAHLVSKYTLANKSLGLAHAMSALALRPDSDIAAAALVRNAEASGQHHLVESTAARLKEKGSLLDRERIARGKSLSVLRDRASSPDEAKQLHQQARTCATIVSSNPELSPDLQIELSQLYLQLGDSQAALENLEGLIEEPGMYPAAQIEFARALIATGQLKNAEDYLLELLRQPRFGLTKRILLFDVLAQLGRNEEAATRLQEVWTIIRPITSSRPFDHRINSALRQLQTVMQTDGWRKLYSLPYETQLELGVFDSIQSITQAWRHHSLRLGLRQ